MDKQGYPYELGISSGEKVFAVDNEPRAFFAYDTGVKWQDLNVTIVKDFTLFAEFNDEESQIFKDYMKELGGDILFLVESYNQRALKIMSELNLGTTSYCQQKFICRPGALDVSCPQLPQGVTVRNFRVNYDEEKYARFYNKVLGHLGTLVDIDFVNNITASSSFDPEGYFIAEEDGEIVGFFSIEKKSGAKKDNSFGYVYQVGVDQQYRGVGLATVLFNKALIFAKKHSLDRIGVGVNKSNTAAVNFFIRNGFKFIYEINGYLMEAGR